MAVGLTFPLSKGAASTVLALYSALILSFLGGARWGLVVARPNPSAVVVTLAMVPTLIGLALLLAGDLRTRLLGLAVALWVHWLWDIRAPGVPDWYGRLRTPLTAGAVVALVAGAFVLPP